MGAGGAGGGSRGVRTPRSGPDRDITRREIDDRRRDEKGRNAAGPLFEQNAILPLDDLESTNAASDVDTGAVGDFRVDLQTRLRHREIGGRDRKLDEAAHFLDVFPLDEVCRIEALHFSRHAGVEGRGIELLDTRDPVASLADSLPGLFGADAPRGHQPDACYYYSARQMLLR